MDAHDRGNLDRVVDRRELAPAMVVRQGDAPLLRRSCRLDLMSGPGATAELKVRVRGERQGKCGALQRMHGRNVPNERWGAAVVSSLAEPH